nr:CapA family protein [Ornithinimicrobium cryptoxanthini]
MFGGLVSGPRHSAPPRPAAARPVVVIGAAVLALSVALALLGGGNHDTFHTPPQVAATAEPEQDPAPAEPAPPEQESAPPEQESAPAEDAEIPEDAETREDAEPTLDPGTEVRLAVVGDIMFARNVGDRIQSEGTGAVLAGVREELHDADLTIGNLESPLCSGGTPAPKGYPFQAAPSSVDVLTDGSFDLVSLANNHILDFGEECMDSTTRLLQEAGIAHGGVGATIDEAREPVVLERHGMRISFLSYLQMPVEQGGFDAQSWTATSTSPGLAWADPEAIREDVTAAQTEADHVIVLLHSGFESTEHLSPEQQAAGNAALEAGATAVLGSHPHQLQAAQERSDGSFIAWSLGNFVFDYPTGATESDTAVLHLTLGPDGVRETSWSPVLIQDGFPVAVPPSQAAGARILSELDRMSQEYAQSLR